MKPEKILVAALVASIVLNGEVRAAPLPKATAQAAEKALAKIPETMRGNLLSFVQTLKPEERRGLLLCMIHRGIFGYLDTVGFDNDVLTGITVDSETTAVENAIEPFDFMEIDFRYDANEVGVMVHADNPSRQIVSPGRGIESWKQLDVKALSKEQRRMIIRRYNRETQTWENLYLPLAGHVMMDTEFADKWLACYPRKIALIDAKDDGAIPAFRMKRLRPDIADRWIPLIYNSHIRTAKAYRAALRQRGIEITNEDTLAFTIHHSALLDMAGYHEFTKGTDMHKVLAEQIKFADDFIDNFNIVIAVFMALPDAQYFDPQTNTLQNHPEFGTITDPAEVWAFGKLWVMAEVIKHLRACHPGVIIALASNRPVLVSDGKAVVDQVNTGKTVIIEPDTINGKLFQRMGQSKHLYAAGADMIITESAEDMTGTEERYSIKDYPARNWDKTGLDQLPASKWLVDANYE